MEVKITGSEKKLTEQELQQAEAELGLKLPEQYRQFLLRHNGGRPKPGDFRIHWIGQGFAGGWHISRVGDFHAIYDEPAVNLLVDYRAYQDRLPPGTLPIATDPGGNFLLLGLVGDNRGKVFFWVQGLPPEYVETDPNNLGLVANSFEEFLNLLFVV